MDGTHLCKIASYIWTARRGSSAVIEDQPHMSLQTRLPVAGVPTPHHNLLKVFIHSTLDTISYGQRSRGPTLRNFSFEILILVGIGSYGLNHEFSFPSWPIVEAVDVGCCNVMVSSCSLLFKDIFSKRVVRDLDFSLAK